MSCISRQVGHCPGRAGLCRHRRPPQVGDSVDGERSQADPAAALGRPHALRRRRARRLGCTGLLGIHWRTKALAANLAACAAAAWDQPWAGGTPAPAGTRETRKLPAGSDRRRQCVQLQVPRGRNQGVGGLSVGPFRRGRLRVGRAQRQLHGDAQVQRAPLHRGRQTLFGVMLQGKEVIHQLDIFAKAGRNKALDFTFPGVDGDRRPGAYRVLRARSNSRASPAS